MSSDRAWWRAVRTAVVPVLLMSSLLAPAGTSAAAEAGPPLILHGATAAGDVVVFSHAGRLWSVPREGGAARRLTDGPAEDFFPFASPDGEHLAFSRLSQDNWDTWRMPSAGGEARRLTFHPAVDRAVGWSADSERILFTTGRDGYRNVRLYTVEAEGSFPAALDLPQGAWGDLSPDGRRLAYAPVALDQDFQLYRYYRGGMTSPLWIADLASGEVTVAAGPEANHWQPVWLGETVYLLSDATGVFNLHALDVSSGEMRALTTYGDHGIRWLSAAAGGEELVYVRDGRIHLYDLVSGTSKPVPVTIPEELQDRGDLEPTTVSLARSLQDLALSPKGDRLALEARGDVLLMGTAEGEGSPRNLTASSGAADRSPAFSPDGRWIATFSDALPAGAAEGAMPEYRLRLIPTSGGEARVIPVEEQPTFYRQPVWSPSGKHIAFTGKRLGLWLGDVEAGTAKLVERSSYLAQELYDPAWSVDGRYLAYSLGFPSHQRSVFIYDLETGQRHRVSGRDHATAPVFDPNGQYLHYLARDVQGLSAANDIWGLLSARLLETLGTSSLRTVLLQDDTPAPFLAATGKANPAARVKEVTAEPGIDFEGIEKRVMTVPTKPLDAFEMEAAGPGTLVLRYRKWPETPTRGTVWTPLAYVDLSAEETTQELVDDVDDFRLSADGSTLAFHNRQGFFLQAVEPGAEARPLEAAKEAEISVDPAKEWRQLYDEAWRIMRDYFYDRGHHGRDLEALRSHFAAYLPAVTRRGDLDLLLREMLGQVSISHMRVSSGRLFETGEEPERGSTLGADFEIDGSRYRIARIYEAAPGWWAEEDAASAPLGQPGLGVEEGEYLLAVDGEPLDASKNVYQALHGKALKPTELTLAKDPSGQGARKVTVVPARDDSTFHRYDAQRKAIQRVEELSGGRLGYIPLNDFGQESIYGFMRDFAALAGSKEGLILDQRRGPGGTTADYLIQLLTAMDLHHYVFPYGETLKVPTSRFSGPKVLLINEQDASASETFPLMFKIAEVGTTVGKRTLGAGTGGALSYPRFIDGARLTIPNRASFNPRTGEWAENVGVAPDVEVELWPKDWREGKDAQLETAVRIALEQLEEGKGAEDPPKRPAFPVHP